jgi:hypothetical protein
VSVRVGKEVQKMLRGLIALVAALPLSAAIFPDSFGEFTKGQTSALNAPDAALYSEYGFQAAEKATYSAAGQSFTVDGWRLRDSTGAFALFQSMRPAQAQTSDVAELAARNGDSLLLAYGNYVLEFKGRSPEKGELQSLYNQLPQLEKSALPILATFLPRADLVANSERFIVGPVSLQKYLPGVPPSVAAFSLGAEAQSGRYSTSKGEMTVAIFNYPTPNIARQRQDEFLKLPGTLAKRSGPLVAVIVQPPDADAAERVLARVNYETNITWSEPQAKENEAAGMGRIIVTGIVFAGVLGLVSLLAGLGLGGIRALLRKLGWSSEPEGITVLRINDK